MSNLFKAIGRGLLYFLLFPVIILGIVLYGVFGIFVFLFQFIKMIILFFTGRNLTSDLKEDIEAKTILNKDKKPEETEEKPTEEKKPELSLYPSDSIVYGSGYSGVVTDVKPATPEEPSISNALPETIEAEPVEIKEKEENENA